MFFFQAEDGIRDRLVTGVQTCALPILNDHTPELCASCLRDSLQALGEITGKISPDDVLEHVFSSFCVGK